jgi:hypothetical protein
MKGRRRHGRDLHITGELSRAFSWDPPLVLSEVFKGTLSFVLPSHGSGHWVAGASDTCLRLALCLLVLSTVFYCICNFIHICSIVSWVLG